MRIPRDLSGSDLIKKLKTLGYEPTRQVGSHLRLTNNQKGQHHLTIPMHNPIKIGTLSKILRDVGDHLELSKEEVLKKLS
jgi:predicted RNA binding protein YcfA (HicA-like mRNA interferase family)